jgi:hypothetical protein
LVKGLQNWIDHPDELKKTKEAARKFAENRFCWDMEAPKFLKLVKEAIS